ncbi:MAG: DUF4397 domain-containing protein [Flavobacteriaceae bacterium]|jgi:hypothetical protein|nr:DUF4397 domain-containing protein [Flavobacteriaceae bacterium]
MKKVLSILLVVFTLGMITSCSNDDGNEYYVNAGGFTMVNAYTGDDAVQYFANGRPIQNYYTPLTYKAYGYINLYSGNRNILIRGMRANERIAASDLRVENNRFYTSFVGGTKENTIHFITQDRVTEVNPLDATNLCGVRFFNLSADEGKFSLQFDEEAIQPAFKDRVADSQASVSKSQVFVPVEAKTYKLSVLDQNNVVIATRNNVQLNERVSYSIMLIGTKTSANKGYYIGVIKQPVN